MQHLESERIAAFDHDAPTAGELAHLEACATCRSERAAFSVLGQRALQLIDAPVPSNTPRLTNWDTLSARLRTEGLITSNAYANTDEREADFERAATSDHDVVAFDAKRVRPQPLVRNDWIRMAAAAVILLAGGAAWGRFTNPAAAPASDSSNLPSITSDFGLLPRSTSFGSVEEASKALAKTERDFNRISLWITANDPSANATDVLRRRLAQLDQVVAASYSASQAAPEDKVLEHYFKSAFAARELTIQQLGSALPPGRSIERF